MFLNIRLAGAILVVLFASISTTSAAVGISAKSKNQSDAGRHRTYSKSFNAGYRSGFARGYRQATTSSTLAPTPFPTEMFGIEVYGANPCYQYNDRDWDLEKIC